MSAHDRNPPFTVFSTDLLSLRIKMLVSVQNVVTNLSSVGSVSGKPEANCMSYYRQGDYSESGRTFIKRNLRIVPNPPKRILPTLAIGKHCTMPEIVDRPGPVARINEAALTAKYAIRSSYGPGRIKDSTIFYYWLPKMNCSFVVAKPWPIAKGFIFRELGKDSLSCLAEKID